MTATKTSKRLSRVAKDLNVATTTIREYLEKKGIEISSNPNARLSNETYEILLEKFQPDKLAKEKAEQVVLPGTEKKEEKAEKQEKEAQASQQSTVGSSNEEAVKTEKEEETIAPETHEEDNDSNDQQDSEAEVVTPEEETDTEKETPESSSQGNEEQQSEERSATEETQPEEISSEEESTEKETQKGPKFLGKVDLDQIEETKPKGKSKKQKSSKSQTKSSKQKEKDSDKEEPQAEETSSPEEPNEKSPEGPTEKEKSVTEELQSSEDQSSELSPPETQEESSEEETEPKEESHSTEKAKTGDEEVTHEDPEVETKESEEEAIGDQKAESSDSLSKKEDYDLKGPTVVGKIDLSEVKSNKPKKKEPVASTSDLSTTRKKRRKRKPVKGEETAQKGEEKQQKDTKKSADQSQSTEKQKEQRKKKGKKKTKEKEEIDSGQVQEQLKETLNKLSGGKSGGSRSKFRKKKRDEERQKEEARQEEIAESEKNKLQVTEFITVNELGNLMDVQVTELIGTCLNLGVMVSMNQRIDAETITILTDEYGYDVEFTEAEMDEPSLEEEDNPDNYLQKPPVVSIMGHVDHGKTSLLDYIQGSKIIAGESGGITQHIGAYEITLQNERNITFLDTPGHEAFTAMRARGAKATDIAVIIIAADDEIKPQTKEAISHAQAAEVPMIFAINKVDKEGASPDRVRQQLAEMNILVEEWGGKYQSQEISAKHGENVDDLLEKVLLESDLLELKADPEKRAVGSVVEAWLDKGKGYVTNLLVESGTLRVGDPVLAGSNMARIRAMMDERGKRVEAAKPGTPVQVLGFDGAPQAGERFYATNDEQTAKEIANERKQLIREQGIRATKHVTLDELGRRLAIGNFQELKVVIKGDVDGSVEAIADSLQKLSTEEIQVRVIHKGVGQISESDVLLASASDAIILGFQVRPSSNARRLAEQEQIDLRMYSVIYDAVQEVKSAMEGMLTPSVEENIVGNVDVRQVFKVSKVGTVAGCKVTSGKITRNAKVRVIRDGVVIHTGEIDTLKRYKDDVKEVASGYECGLNIKNFNDIVEGDYLEVYEEVEVKRSLN